MTRPTREELEDMREEGLSAAVREGFEASRRAVDAWQRSRPSGLAEVLDWVDELRRVFGDPEVDRTPWAGDDFRI